MRKQQILRRIPSTPWIVCLVLSAAWSSTPASVGGKVKDDPKAIVNSLGMKLVWIPKGDFQMGSEEFPSERPPRPARVTQDFYLAIHHVTVAQFRTFVKDAKYKTDAEKNGKGAGGLRQHHPLGHQESGVQLEESRLRTRQRPTGHLCKLE